MNKGTKQVVIDDDAMQALDRTVTVKGEKLALEFARRGSDCNAAEMTPAALEAFLRKNDCRLDDAGRIVDQSVDREGEVWGEVH